MRCTHRTFLIEIIVQQQYLHVFARSFFRIFFLSFSVRIYRLAHRIRIRHRA